MGWYYANNSNGQVGPIEKQEILQLINSNTITSDTLFWKEGMDDWKAAGDTELAEMFSGSSKQKQHSSPPPISDTSQKNNSQASGSTSSNDQTVGFDRDPAKVYPSNPPRSPHVCWWNLLLGGVGQMILGQGGKGAVILGVQIISNFFLPIVLALIIGILSIVDAYMVGKALKQGQVVGKWDFFPST